MTKLAELKAAYEAATPGEWEPLMTCGEQHVCTLTADGSDVMTVAIPMYNNADFIALAHNAMPMLLEAANHLAECQELLHDYPWVYQKCKQILENLK